MYTGTVLNRSDWCILVYFGPVRYLIGVVMLSNVVTEMTDWEFTIVSLEAKSWQFAAATQEVISLVTL